MSSDRVLAIAVLALIVAAPYLAIYLLYEELGEAIANPLSSMRADKTRLCGPLLLGVAYVSGGAVVGGENIGNKTVRIEYIGIVPSLPLYPVREYVLGTGIDLPPGGRFEYRVNSRELAERYLGIDVLAVRVEGVVCKIELW